MSNTILLKRNGNAAAVPAAANLTLGELSLNYADGVLYFLNSSNVVTVLANANTVSGTQLVNGTSNVVTRTSGNVTISSAGTANVFTVTSTGIYTTGLSSVSGNITGGNLSTGGVISATGNVTGSYFIGNGSQLTGITASGGSSIVNGTSNVVVAASGNVTISSAGTANVFTVTSTGIYTTGLSSVTGNITGGNLLTGGLVSATGNITSAANVSAATHVGTAVSVSGAVTAASVVGGVMTGTSVSVSGAVTGASLTTAGVLTVNSGNAVSAIVNGAATGQGNIGSSTTTFNTVYAKATTAQYADLAEKYTADATYAPGTVLVFGGNQEVTVNSVDSDRRVAGVVSTDPGFVMNEGLEATYVATVALTGRVPTLVIGPVRKGDLMVAAGLGRARAEADPKIGTVIGKALEDFDGESGTIEIVVGRF